MTLNETMRELEAMGTEQTRKTYRRHGARDPMFGVLTSNIAKLAKKIKTDHALALELWDTGNTDACVLATMIADPKQMDMATLNRWISDCQDYGTTNYVAGLGAKTPVAFDALVEWTASDDEWQGSGGWHILAQLAMFDQALPDSFFTPYLDTIEHDIHNRKNRVRYEMNGALIAIGSRNETLEARALDIAGKIGKVYVDHGQTSCKTPDPTTYILKSRAYQKARAATA